VAERDNIDGVSCTGSAIGGATSSAVAVVPNDDDDGEGKEAPTFVDIPIVTDALTFDESVAAETQKLDELADAERRRQRHRWRQEVDMMQQEIVVLDRHRAARRCRSESPTAPDYATATAGERDRPTPRRQPRLPPNYFRRFYDTSGFDQQNVRVSVERGTLVLGVSRLPVPEPDQSTSNDNCDQTPAKDVRRRTRYYRFPIPPSVDLATIRAVLSSDGVLLVEADTGSRTLSSPDQSLCSSGTDSGGPPTLAKREKIGKPVFKDDEDGKRRMRLLVDVGDSFRPKDIYVQAMKSDRFEVCLSLSARTLYSIKTFQLVIFARKCEKFCLTVFSSVCLVIQLCNCIC